MFAESAVHECLDPLHQLLLKRGMKINVHIDLQSRLSECPVIRAGTSLEAVPDCKEQGMLVDLHEETANSVNIHL